MQISTSSYCELVYLTPTFPPKQLEKKWIQYILKICLKASEGSRGHDVGEKRNPER